MKASARNKFDRTGTYACENCGKRTRNVDGESTVGLCKACYEQCEQDNKEADGRMDDRQVADEMAKELQYGLTHLTMEPEEEEDGETDIDTNKIVPSLPPASGAAIIPADFPRFSQRDPRWASDKLGTSDSTMGGWGCVVTSNAAVYKYLGIDTDPGRLNQLMIGWNGYDDTNLWRWWTPTLYLPITWEREPKGTTARGRIDLVRQLTNAGIAPILCVDFNLAQTDLQSHFLVGLAVTPEKDIIVMDSWDGTVKLFSKTYGSPLWGIWRVDIYRKKE